LEGDGFSVLGGKMLRILYEGEWEEMIKTEKIV
jgi:hypothetical protein